MWKQTVAISLGGRGKIFLLAGRVSVCVCCVCVRESVCVKERKRARARESARERVETLHLASRLHPLD